jgi:hypothetical protein
MFNGYEFHFEESELNGAMEPFPPSPHHNYSSYVWQGISISVYKGIKKLA